MNNTTRTNDADFDVFDILITIAKHKWLIFIITIVVSIAAVAYSLLAKEVWGSSATFITLSDDMSASMGNSILGGMGLDFMGGFASEESMNNLLILDSRDFAKKIVRKFDLITYYEISEKDSLKEMDKAIKKLKKETFGIFYDKETNSITVSANTFDKQLSKDIVEYVLTELVYYNQNENMTKGKLKRIFMEERVQEIDKEFNELTAQILAQKEDSKMISIEDQTSKILTMYSDLVAELTKTNIQITISKELYGDKSPMLNELVLKRDELQKKIDNMETVGGISEFIVPINDIPSIAMQSQILEMKLKINRKIYEFLYPQYELAKMEELKDLPTINIISNADLPGLRVKPKRAIVCVVSFFIALFFSIVISILIEYVPQDKKMKLIQARKIFFS